jgi:hypothetical protein
MDDSHVTTLLSEVCRAQVQITQHQDVYHTLTTRFHFSFTSDYKLIDFDMANNSFHGAKSFSRSAESCQLRSCSRTSKYYMAHDGSVQSSQRPSTDVFRKPDQSNPYHLILMSISILPVNLLLDLPTGLLILACPRISHMPSSSPPSP